MSPSVPMNPAHSFQIPQYTLAYPKQSPHQANAPLSHSPLMEIPYLQNENVGPTARGAGPVPPSAYRPATVVGPSPVGGAHAGGPTGALHAINVNSSNVKPLRASTNPRYKTVLCANFSKTGYCGYANKCQFAHGVHELPGRHVVTTIVTVKVPAPTTAPLPQHQHPLPPPPPASYPNSRSTSPLMMPTMMAPPHGFEEDGVTRDRQFESSIMRFLGEEELSSSPLTYRRDRAELSLSTPRTPRGRRFSMPDLEAVELDAARALAPPMLMPLDTRNVSHETNNTSRRSRASSLPSSYETMSGDAEFLATNKSPVYQALFNSPTLFPHPPIELYHF